MTFRNGYVYLVGAGPGDPGLLTIKGAQCINKADVIIYDRLIGKKILAYARPDAELIYVGKSPARHTLSQDEINQLLVATAQQGKIVTRLKGGDPFVFGRGGEEAEVLSAHQIPFEIIPGITSAIAVPAYAGIPVTHRDCTSTLGIITGNEDPAKDDSSIEWDRLATGLGTLVFLMGMSNLAKIVDKLTSFGRSPATPVALVRWGTRPEQQTLVGTLADIVAKATEAGFENPAIIIVGEVVKLREKLHWFEKRPLFGKKILVTRSREQASVLSAKIEELGGEALEFPTIAIAPPDSWTPLDQAIRSVRHYDYLIFTSTNGVKMFFERLSTNRIDIRSLFGLKICAIGPKTRELLEQLGLIVDYMPDEFVAEAIISHLQGQVKPGDKILLPRSDLARDLLVESLRKMGAQVTEIIAYQTRTANNAVNDLAALLSDNKVDFVTFTSSSTVTNFLRYLPAEQRSAALKDMKIACIGPITAQTAQELGLHVDITAKEYTIEGLVKSIVEYCTHAKA